MKKYVHMNRMRLTTSVYGRYNTQCIIIIIIYATIIHVMIINDSIDLFVLAIKGKIQSLEMYQENFRRCAAVKFWCFLQIREYNPSPINPAITVFIEESVLIGDEAKSSEPF